MKLIALDVGTKRIGVAKADSSVRIAIPYSAIEVNNGEEFKKIASLARAWDINNFVIGLPRNSKGEETEQSRYVRNFAKDLKRHISAAKICFQDESLTSVEAEKRLKNRKKGYKKGDIDSEAAAIILQDFIEEKTGKPTTRAAAAKHKSVKGTKPHRFLTAFIAVLILLVLVGGAACGYYFYSLTPVANVDCNSATADECNDTLFAVENGANVANIAAELKEENLIRDAFVFQVYYRLNSGGKSLKAGEYQFNQTMSTNEIVDILISGGRDNVFSFTVFPGSTISDIKASLVEHGYDEADVEAAFAASYDGKDYSWIFEGRPEGASLEGYLYGDTYEFYRDDSVNTIIETFLKGMATAIKDNDLQKKFADQGYNIYQGITLASVVQREANNAADMAKVAKVFMNRMASDMNLGSDVTAQYAANLAREQGEVIEDNETVINLDSPYNTRLPAHRGLPYGPISNPGLDALLAVATPDNAVEGKLYFLTGDDGLMYYSTTWEEHNQNIIDHCADLCSASL